MACSFWDASGSFRAVKNAGGPTRWHCCWPATIAAFLVLFSTNIPVYDGERLFLHVFPAWALLIGLGFGTLWNHYRSQAVRSSFRIVLAGFLVVQGYGLVSMHPFGLSFYNGLVGGLAGAERLGLELTYWNDAVDRVLLDRLRAKARRGPRRPSCRRFTSSRDC